MLDRRSLHYLFLLTVHPPSSPHLTETLVIIEAWHWWGSQPSQSGRPSAPGDTAHLTLAPPSARGGWWQHIIEVKKRKHRWWKENAEAEYNVRKSIKRGNVKITLPHWITFCFIWLIQLEIWTKHFIICLYLSKRKLNFRKVLLTIENKITWGYSFV